MSQYKIAPSILAADYANFEREIKRLEATGAEYAHIDIMDGHFVPQISFGAGVVESLRPHSKMVFDCHLMVANPEHHWKTLRVREQISSASMWKQRLIFMAPSKKFIHSVLSLRLSLILVRLLKPLSTSFI